MLEFIAKVVGVHSLRPKNSFRKHTKLKLSKEPNKFNFHHGEVFKMPFSLLAYNKCEMP